jgi:methyl-accepting chemotaxis protein WspA
MNTWSIRYRILASFAAVLALMIVMGAVAYACLARVAQAAAVIQTGALPGMSLSSRLLSTWLENFDLTRQHVAETEGSEMRKIESQLQANQVKLENLTKSFEGTLSNAQDRKENYEAFNGRHLGELTCVCRRTF